MRRAEGRETFHRLLEWDKGQAVSERLAALILEQLPYFSYANEQGITRIERKLDDLCENLRNQSKRISVFDDTDGEEVRTLEEVLEAENMFCDKIWFDRHLSLEYRIE